MGKKILHILNSDRFSGAENVVVTIIESFKKMGDDTEFVYVSRDGSIRQVVEERGIAFEAIQSMSPKELRRIIKKYKPHCIHAHDFTASIIAAVSAGRIPVISHLHNNSPWIKTYCLNSFVFGLSCFKYKYILGVSDSVFDEYVFGKYILAKSKVVGNPIDISRGIDRAEGDNAFEEYDVAFLGRLCEPKDPIRFIEIIKKLNIILPIKAVMLGDGPYREMVESKILEYGLKDSIELKGFVNNPYKILKNCKVLCAPSKWEGFGLMAVEALSLGVPVAASPVGGLVDIVTERCGALCSTDDEFVEFMSGLIADKELCRKFSKEADKRAAELDNIKEYCGELKKIYEGSLTM